MNGHSQEPFYLLCVLAHPNNLTPRIRGKPMISLPNPVGRLPLRAESTPAAAELRAAIRHQAALNVEFRWVESGTLQAAKGQTRNVSPRGAFIHAVQCPPDGTRLEVTFDLSFDQLGSSPLRLEAEAQVLRIERPRDSFAKRGFAVQFRHARMQTT